MGLSVATSLLFSGYVLFAASRHLIGGLNTSSARTIGKAAQTVCNAGKSDRNRHSAFPFRVCVRAKTAKDTEVENYRSWLRPGRSGSSAASPAPPAGQCLRELVE